LMNSRENLNALNRQRHAEIEQWDLNNEGE
jgi:hypothetical protein